MKSLHQILFFVATCLEGWFAQLGHHERDEMEIVLGKSGGLG